MKIIILAMAAFIPLCLVCSCTNAGGNRTWKPLVKNQQEMKSALEAALACGGQPSASCALVQSEGPALIASAGTSRLPDGTPVNTKSLYHIGSTTKSMTALLAMILVEQGKLQLSTTLSEVFPDMKMRTEYRDMDMLDLMMNRAGIIPFQQTANEDPQVVEDLWQRIPANHPDDPTGERAAMTAYTLALPSAGSTKSNPLIVYSNAGWAILGHCLETILGISYEQALTELVFNPLGISNFKIGGWPNDNYDPAQPVGHYPAEAKGASPQAQTAENDYLFPDWMNPAGGVNIDIEGFTAYAREQLQGLKGKGTLLSQTGYSTMHSIQAQADIETMYQGAGRGTGTIKFGLGWAVEETDSGLFSMADGSGGTFYARLIVYPALDIAFAGFTNSGSGEVLSDVIRRTTGFEIR
ncbi:MAG: beta-lactamase family protein [Spirochaetales bacterium]|nr:beta-lactamase family protein [Spirochaetales bacterium]